MVLTGTSVAGSAAARALAAAYPDLWSTAGVHPHHASELDANAVATLRALARAPVADARRKVVAIGECGLDYNRDFSPREKQRWAFEQQLELGASTGLPVFLHCRDAHDDFVEILARWRPQLGAAVVHCFTGSSAELEAYLDLDCHIGITGWICDERRGGHLQKLVGRIPEGRLMIETDAPFLLPRDLPKARWGGKKRSRRNEPAFLDHVCAAVARARGESAAKLAHHTTQAALNFFDLRERGGG